MFSLSSAVLRFRPIMLTAIAAIMGMVPLFTNSFWGPMAVAMSGGLFVATILTLLVLPANYTAWYKADNVCEYPQKVGNEYKGSF